MTTPVTFLRAEVWSDYACNSGVPLAHLADVLLIQVQRSIVDEQVVTLRIHRDNAAYGVLDYGAILTLRYSDLSTEEWRVVKKNRVSNNSGGIVDITCAHPIMDLGEMPFLSQQTGGGDTTYVMGTVDLDLPNYVADFIIPAVPSYIAAGTIDPTILLSLTFDHVTPLAALLQMVDAVTSNKIPCELQLRKNGSTNYLIDLVSQIGSSGATATLFVGKDIDELEEDGDDTPHVSAFMSVGADGATLRRSAWPINSVVSSTVLELKDFNGGAGPFIVDDQANDPINLYVVRPDTGALLEVTDSVATSDMFSRITISATTGFAVGDLVEFKLDASGNFVDLLTLPGQRTKFGTVTDTTFRGDYNIVPNAYQNNYANTSDAADGWTFDGTHSTSGGSPDATIARATPPAPTFGAFYAHITDHQVGGLGPGFSDATGCYLASKPSPWVFNQTDFSTLSFKIRLYIVTLFDGGDRWGLRIQLERFGATAGAFGSRTNPIATIDTAPDIAPNTIVELASSGTMDTSGQYFVRIMGIDQGALTARPADGAKTEFYAGECQITQTSANVDWLQGSEATRLWQLANLNLAENLGASVQYTAQVKNLAAIDPVHYAHTVPTLGGTVDVKDSTFGLDLSLRCIGITETLTPGTTDQPQTKTLTLGAKLPTLTQTLARSLLAAA